MRETLGWLLVAGGMAALLLFVFALFVYQYEHERFTDAQLLLWCLRGWWRWAPAMSACMAGLTMLRRARGR